MQLATIELGDRRETSAVVVEGSRGWETGFRDVGELLRGVPDLTGWISEWSGTRTIDLESATYRSPILRPGKIVCVGLNYRSHIIEMGRTLPEYPTLFYKVPETVIGPFDPIVLTPAVAETADWETELAVVVGKRAHRVPLDEASGHIAGYTIFNDVSVRELQYRTTQWFQGKNVAGTCPLGPYVETDSSKIADAFITTKVDGDIVQRARVSDLLFDPDHLMNYISTLFPLEPGDIIATGTPGGVGHASDPPRYLNSVASVSSEIDGLGHLHNEIRMESVSV